MVFGIPLVMNPYFFLPFILTPVLLVIVSYTAMATGLVAPPAGIALPFTTPIFISGYLATGGHISGTVLQVVNLAISLVVYYPFFRAWGSAKGKEERRLGATQASAAIADPTAHNFQPDESSPGERCATGEKRYPCSHHIASNGRSVSPVGRRGGLGIVADDHLPLARGLSGLPGLQLGGSG